ncbi:MAG: hypothetical protein U0103_00405 [Candidatus Obscuribacterales bacterium]|nr:MAG: hypothetical protein EKK48_11760 [Candidatus Melainabacteria bacterium]
MKRIIRFSFLYDWTSHCAGLLILLTFAPGCFPQPAFSQQRIAPSGWIEDSQPASNLVPKGSATGARAPLQGGVQHSDELRPLPSNLQSGAIFDEKSIPKTADDVGWYQIPDWLAGKWLREEETILSTYFFESKVQQNEPRTIAEREIAEFGFQRDKQGKIWHYRLASKGVSDCGSYLAVAFVQSQEPLHVAEDLVVIRDVFVEVQVNKETNVIMHSSQAESITKYRPLHDGLIKTSMSVKVFNEDGTPYTVQRNIAADKRIEAFKSTDTFKEHNLRKSFADFLHVTGRDDLIP